MILKKKITNKLIWPLLFGAAFLFSTPTYANLKIAVVDTGFCSQKIKTTSKTQKIKDAQDMTETNQFDCKKIPDKELSEAGRFHGQNVLNEFLKYLPKEIEITVYPLIVYDQKGVQSESAWRKSIAYIEAEKMDMVLTASGFITADKLQNTLPSIWFIPSGRVEHGITFQTKLFPQNLAPQTNIFMIGDYYDGKDNFYDQALLYQDQIDYFFPSGKGKFIGASRAVAEAMAIALKQCFIPSESVSTAALRTCLINKQKTLKDPILKKEFKTF